MMVSNNPSFGMWQSGDILGMGQVLFWADIDSCCFHELAVG